MALIYTILLSIGLFLLFYIPKALIGEYKVRPIKRATFKPVAQPSKVKVRANRANRNIANLAIINKGRA